MPPEEVNRPAWGPLCRDCWDARLSCGRRPGPASLSVFPGALHRPAWGVGAAVTQEGALGVQTRKPEVFSATSEMPAGFLEWPEASGQGRSGLGGVWLATMPQLH